MDAADESALVRQAQAGDRVSFSVLVDNYWEPIRRWLFRLLGHAHLAEDLTQETFVKAWQALPSFQTMGGFRSWLYCIARNLAIDAKRGPRGRPMRDLPAGLPSDAAEPVAKLLEREAIEKLQEACGRLPSPYREAYLLWTYDELPYAEIAVILGSTEEMARWRVCKARQMLLKELEGYLGERRK